MLGGYIQSCFEFKQVKAPKDAAQDNLGARRNGSPGRGSCVAPRRQDVGTGARRAKRRVVTPHRRLDVPFLNKLGVRLPSIVSRV